LLIEYGLCAFLPLIGLLAAFSAESRRTVSQAVVERSACGILWRIRERDMRFRLANGLLVVAWVLVARVHVSAAATDCDRACLKTALDQYLNAAIKHDPAAAPLMVGFRQTENAVVVRPGTGLWKSMTALRKLQRRYLDPVSGQAGYFAPSRKAALQPSTRSE
jgi:hypothetical protein